jgi:hypothetical protein
VTILSSVVRKSSSVRQVAPALPIFLGGLSVGVDRGEMLSAWSFIFRNLFLVPFVMCQARSLVITTRFGLNRRSSFPGRYKTFPYFSPSRPTLGPTFQWEPLGGGGFPPGKNVRGVKSIIPMHFPICLHGVVLNDVFTLYVIMAVLKTGAW